MSKTILTTAILAFVLAACGGGGGSDQSASPTPAPVANEAQGIYQGTDASNDQIVGVILDTGAYYFVYVNQSTNAVGLIQGTSTASGGIFTSSDAKNFVIAQNAVLNETVSATYALKTSISGTITPSPATTLGVKFNGTYNSLYEQGPNIPNIAGTYSGVGGSIVGGENVSVTISPVGVISGVGVSGCSFSGNIASHAGRNLYDATITFGDKFCTYPGRSVTGVLSANNNQLIAAAPFADRSDAFILVGSK